MTYKYLASPYSDPDPMVRELRFLRASETLKTLLGNKIWTYSPIVHCHELSKVWGMPSDAEFWKEYDAAMVAGSNGIFVLMLDGWSKSVGVKGEIELATSLGKSITYMKSGNLDDAATCSIHPDKS